jgi:hypothetical protein
MWEINGVLQRVKEVRNILYTVNYHLTHIIAGKIEGRIDLMRRRGRRHKQLLNDLQEKSGYWKLKEQALDCTVWKTCFERNY